MTAPAAIWAVVPAKPFAAGKSRLGLPEYERIALNRAFLAHVVGVAAAVVGPGRTLVVSHDEAALALARRLHARALRERGDGLNEALAAGSDFAGERGADGVLSLFADLPWLAGDDLTAMIRAYDGGNVVIAPDAGGTGTNALLMPPGALAYRHGAGSFWRHLTGARVRFHIACRPGLANDVDTPAMLAKLRAQHADYALGALHHQHTC